MLKLMIIFSIIGGIDKILNNRFGLGEKFEEGFRALGGLALSIIGIYSLSPLIGRFLSPLLVPLGNISHTDPSLFIASLLAPDLGGYNTAMEVARSPILGEYNGLILSSMLGTTISFIIPVAVGLISKEDFKYFAKGVLAGILTIPFGMLVGGFAMGLGFTDIIFSIIPVTIFTLFIGLGLVKIPDKMVEIFSILGRGIIIVSTLGLIMGIISFIFSIDLIDGFLPLEEGAIIVINIGIILSGAYPMLFFISRKFNRTLLKIGKKINLNEYSILGLFSSLANCIPMLGIYDKMNEKGKVLNAAFAVSGAFSFGGQMAYVSSVSARAVNPFIISKLSAGIMALLLASFMFKFENKLGGN